MSYSPDCQSALAHACDLIAPVWPLDQWIAVNPFWGLRDRPVTGADNMLQQRAGVSILMPAAFYREAWQGGRITQADLQASLNEAGQGKDLQPQIDALDSDAHTNRRFRLSILDTLPDTPDGRTATEAVYDDIGRLCGAYFDHRQARWKPEANVSGMAGFFDFWLAATQRDLSLEYRTGVSGARKRLKALPQTRQEALGNALAVLQLDADELAVLCHSLLLRINGWASWCSGVDWRAALRGDTSGTRESLLSVLLVWEAVAVQCASTEQKAARASAWEHWHQQHTLKQPVCENDKLWIWQRAYEISYQRSLNTLLQEPPHSPANRDAGQGCDIQAVFCIDVRSEVLRRHLEHHNPRVRTLGFAGFFGLPVSHQRHGPFSEVSRLPGLLAPAYRFVDTQGTRQADMALNRALDQREITRESVRKAKYSSLSSFTLVETTGLAWAWKLLRDSLHKSAQGVPDSSKPMQGTLVHALGGDPVSVPEKVELVAGFLKGMSLTRGFAPLVVFVGHGTQTDNNPNHAGMACGACGGQSGVVSARLAAALFNDPQVREGLSEEGIRVPETTLAIAAEHCTVTDEVMLFDQDRIANSHRNLVTELEESFLAAGQSSRKERATPLRLNGLDDSERLVALRKRTQDWSEIRPEWGLANNAAIIFAKRSLTRGRNLAGRAFLHDYDSEQDPDGTVLEALLCAPMMVANWINLQYFASVTAPEVYGAGNKLLHSVVGGNLGVIEGNGTDLRIGLPLQSVHDGVYWRHEPLRLTVLIDAPRAHIEAIIQRQPDVAQLVDNQWLWLHRLLPEGHQERFTNGVWQACPV